MLLVILVFAAPWAKRTEGGQTTRSVDLLEQLTGFDKSLLGVFPFVVYVANRNAGHGEITVARASDASGAVYYVKTAAQIRIGSYLNRSERNEYLDKELALVTSSMSQTEYNDGVVTSTFNSRYERDLDDWKVEATRDGETWSTQFPIGGQDYGNDASIFMLCRAAALTEGSAIPLGAISWVHDVDPTDRQGSMFIEVGEGIGYEHGGERLRAFVVSIKGSDHLDSLVLSRDREILEMRFGSMVRWIAGTKGEVDDPEPILPTADTPQGVIALLYRISARLAPPDSLDAIVDWHSCYTLSVTRDSSMASVSLEEFVKQKKEEVETRELLINPGLIEIAVESMVFRIDGDEATVATPDQPDRPLIWLTRTQCCGWKLLRWD